MLRGPLTRRYFVSWLAGATAAWPLAARAQKIPLIASLDGDTSHSRASSMYLTQWLNQASAVVSLLSELPGQSIQKI